MKKLISIVLVALLLATAFTFPAYATTSHVNNGDTPVFNGATSENAFGDLLNWNGIVFGDTNNVYNVEGSLAVNGTFTFSATGLSVNGGVNGANHASTEDVALLVHDNAIINGSGDVWGQTVIGNNEGNAYNISNITPSNPTGWPKGCYTVADSTQYFENAKKTANDVKAAVEALTVNGSYEVLENTVYKFKGDKDADVLVYNIKESNFVSYRFDFEIEDNQTVVLNFTATENIRMDHGAWSINDKLQDLPYLKGYNRNIIINIANAQELEMSNCDMYGILLAPDTTLKGRQGYVCGTSIVKSIDCPQGLNGFGLLLGGNSSFIPAITSSDTEPYDPDDPADKGNIRIDVPLKMAVVFDDGTVYYGGEMKEVEFGKEYPFQMCSVNWDNGKYDENGNGVRGTVVYSMTVVHQKEFNEFASAAKENPERYTVKGIDIIDNEAKKIIVNGDAKDTHLETDVNNFFMAYRFHFKSQDYNKKTGIVNVVNTPLESLSVNLPLGSTIACDAYIGDNKVDSANVFITNNSGEGVYDDVLLTSVNDYTWDH